MNLVNELQVSAERDDVLTVLRKAKRLASKLGVDDINDWLRCEQEGYENGDTIPKYRKIKGTVVFRTNGPIPVGMSMLADGIMDYPGNIMLDTALPDSMSEVGALISQCAERNHELFFPMDDSSVAQKLRSRMNRMIASKVSLMLRMNMGQVQAIPEAVKDRVLEWACELERRGVRGDSMTFNDQEKAIAHNITFNISNSKIGQLNNMGNNINRSDDNG